MSRPGLTVAGAAALIPLVAFVAWLLDASSGTIVVLVVATYGVAIPLAVAATARRGPDSSEPGEAASEDAPPSAAEPDDDTGVEVEAEEAPAEARLRRLIAERRSLLEELATRTPRESPEPADAGLDRNIWDLERTAAELRGRDPQADYERSLLLVYLREFADSSGRLSGDFDELIREAFPERVAP